MLPLLVLTACKAPEPSNPNREPPTSSDDTTDALPPVDSSTGTTGTTGSTGETGVEAPDCSVLPAVPVTFQALPYPTSEDFDFDGDGYLCTFSNQNLRCRDQLGDSWALSPGLSGLPAGTRFLATGDWVVADVFGGALIRVDTVTGGSAPILGGLLYPNGIEVDANNHVFVAENSGGRVRQIDAYTGEQWIVAEGLSDPNGVILSPDGNTLYVGTFGGGVIYAIDRLGPTEWDEERVLYEPAGPDGGFDGINVDICGNVYITEYGTGRIYRITPDGLDTAVVVSLPTAWIPNLRWGNGIGGWETDILYVAAFDAVYALDMNIDGKPHVLFQ